MQDDAPDGPLGLLRQAAEIVAQRRQQYGPPAEHFEQVARRWSSPSGPRCGASTVLLCQLDLKLVRLAHDPGHRDSLVDLIGYSLLLHELVDDPSGAEPTAAAEVAEVAEADGCAGGAAAEALLKSAEEERRSR